MSEQRGVWVPLRDGEYPARNPKDSFLIETIDDSHWLTVTELLYEGGDDVDSTLIELPPTIRLCQLQPAAVGLTMPDGPGWWAFEGAKWESKPIYLYEGVEYSEWQEGWDEDAEEYWNRYELNLFEPFRYEKVPGDMFQALIKVRYSTLGEQVRFLSSMGRYEGEPILGYIPPNPTWNHYLHAIETLTGTWTRVYTPWDTPAQEANNVE